MLRCNKTIYDMQCKMQTSNFVFNWRLVSLSVFVCLSVPGSSVRGLAALRGSSGWQLWQVLGGLPGVTCHTERQWRASRAVQDGWLLWMTFWELPARPSEPQLRLYSAATFSHPRPLWPPSRAAATEMNVSFYNLKLNKRKRKEKKRKEEHF